MKSPVTFIISSLRGGGAEGVCVSLANGLAARGYDVTVVVLNLQRSVRQNSLSPAVRLVDLESGHARSSWRLLHKYLVSARPSMVLSFNRQISVVLVLLRAIFRLKFRLIARNIIHLSTAEDAKQGVWHGWFVRHLIKRFYPRVDHFIAQSSGMKLDLEEYLGVRPEKISVIPNPVAPEVAKNSGSEAPPSLRDRQYLLCVGRLDAQKAFHFAIGAFSQVVATHPGLRLRIVGQGPAEAELRKLVDVLNISDKVEFCGFQKEVGQYYLAAKLTLLTSLYEGLPNVLIESIALGTPVVAFDCPSGPEDIVIEGVNGFLVALGDTHELREKIELALSREWSQEQIIRSAGKFELEYVLDQYERVLAT